MLIIQRPTVEAIGDEQHNRQQFAVGPLDPGFGHTLGNSLRRTLLSSIPGAAVTQVRFDDALHEFTTINGVKEDVTDIILNLKDLLLRSDNDGSVVIRLDKSGPADVTAADFIVPTGVEILNPELHIATVNASGRLAVDVTVDRGVGYVSADRNKRSNIIGVVPVDSIFSPVRRCTYTVEPVRVEQSTDYDRIVLDIETDGTISPREALASAGATLSSSVLVSTPSVSSWLAPRRTCFRSPTSVKLPSRTLLSVSKSAVLTFERRRRPCAVLPSAGVVSAVRLPTKRLCRATLSHR